MDKKRFSWAKNLLEPLIHIVLISFGFLSLYYSVNHPASVSFYADLDSGLIITPATRAANVVNQLTMGDVTNIAVAIGMACIMVTVWIYLCFLIPGIRLTNMVFGALRRRHPIPLIDAAYRAENELSSERQQILIAVIDAFMEEDEL